jgi:hypothetical protein
MGREFNLAARRPSSIRPPALFGLCPATPLALSGARLSGSVLCIARPDGIFARPLF